MLLDFHATLEEKHVLSRFEGGNHKSVETIVIECMCVSVDISYNTIEVMVDIVFSISIVQNGILS